MSQEEAYMFLRKICEFASKNPLISVKFSNWKKTFQFKPSEASPFFLEFSDGKIGVEKGLSQAPQASLVSSHQDLLEILRGKLDPFKAFFTGKLKIEGDIGETQKLGSILRAVSSSPDFEKTV